jgi:hypothetical protein
MLIKTFHSYISQSIYDCQVVCVPTGTSTFARATACFRSNSNAPDPGGSKFMKKRDPLSPLAGALDACTDVLCSTSEPSRMTAWKGPHERHPPGGLSEWHGNSNTT